MRRKEYQSKLTDICKVQFGFIFMFRTLSKMNIFSLLSMSTCLILSACDVSKPPDLQQGKGIVDHKNHRYSENEKYITAEVDEGKKLTDIAGQAILPASATIKNLDHDVTISHQAEEFVGRYHAEISCEDPFVLCDHGKAEFIINLLPDGTAHRTIAYMGKMTYENREISSNRSYQKNTWSYDPDQKEIIVNRGDGSQFFYTVNADHNLVINLNKILNSSEMNKKYFSDKNNPAPENAYVLKKYNN